MRLAVKALLAWLFAVCVYRAVAQSLVHDEALTYELYILGPVQNIFHYFDPNHHFLNTILMWASASMFGVSELALRLPALAGAILYFTSVYRLAWSAFGETVLFPLAAGLLSLNPFVLDFMVAARGYGMALALLMFALAMLSEALQAEPIPPKKLMLAGAALGLSVTANLIFALPAAGVAGVAVYLLPRPQPVPVKPSGKRSKRKRPERPKRWPLWIWLAAPALFVGLLFLQLAPIENMRLEQFYTGADSIRESLRSLATATVEHSGPLRTGRVADLWRDTVAFLIAPVLVAGALAVGWRRRDRLLLLASAPLVFASLVLLPMHYLLGRPYPADRTGMYFAPMACLALVGLARVNRMGARGVYALSAILLVQFVLEFNTRKFLVWEYDADTREMGRYIDVHRNHAAGTVRLGGSWQLTRSMSYYMVRNDWTWLAIERRPPEPGYDYYMFIPQDAGLVVPLGLSVVYRGPVSGSILAVRSR